MPVRFMIVGKWVLVFIDFVHIFFGEMGMYAGVMPLHVVRYDLTGAAK